MTNSSVATNAVSSSVRRRVAENPVPTPESGASVASPLIVGITGHRNLVPDEVPRLRELVREFLGDLVCRFPDLRLSVMSPLAEGADRLVAEEALALDLPLIAPLPMPLELYTKDFASDSSIREFESLCAAAEVFELPLLDGVTPADASEYGAARNRQYAQLGIYICAHCHILLALWDGKPSPDLGGTAQVVQFHHDDIMPGFTDSSVKARMLLTDDESDLVYHIVCSRNQPDGAPVANLRPLEKSWFTTDAEAPRTADLPKRYVQIFERTAEFNRDAIRHAERIRDEAWSLISDDAPDDIDDGSVNINNMFVIADWLAMHFQQKFHGVLKSVHVLAVVTGLAFLAYADIDQSNMIYGFLIGISLAAISLTIADRLEWHRKYLDYRALAEGMRIQFYLSLAGIDSGRNTKFTHDNFLQKQDQELGWIRNVMRVAGLIADINPTSSSASRMEYTIREWVDGQTDYYRRKTEERGRLDSRTARASLVCLSCAIGLAVVLAVMMNQLDERIQDWLVILMGILPLIAAALDAYSNKMAAKELSNQYRFMSRVFANAQSRLRAETDPDAQREILRALGEASLDEHAEWIIMHRQRPPELGGL